MHCNFADDVNVDDDVNDDDDDDDDDHDDDDDDDDVDVDVDVREEEDRSQDREAHFVRAWAQSKKCTGTFQKSHFVYRNLLQEKCRTPIPRTSFCASLRSRNAHGHVTRPILCGNYRENAGRQS